MVYPQKRRALTRNAGRTAHRLPIAELLDRKQPEFRVNITIVSAELKRSGGKKAMLMGPLGGGVADPFVSVDFGTEPVPNVNPYQRTGSPFQG